MYVTAGSVWHIWKYREKIKRIFRKVFPCCAKYQLKEAETHANSSRKLRRKASVNTEFLEFTYAVAAKERDREIHYYPPPVVLSQTRVPSGQNGVMHSSVEITGAANSGVNTESYFHVDQENKNIADE